MKMNSYEKKHLKELRPYLAECAVLLKKSGAFPLDKPGKIAAYGGGVRHTLKGGTGSGDVNSRFTVNVEEGLARAGFTITTEGWLNDYDEIIAGAHDEFIEEIKRRAREKHTLASFEGMGAVMAEPEYDLPMEEEGDACVYVLSRICGEGNDRTPTRGDLLLTDTEIHDILALNEKFEKFMLVLNVGGPVDLSPVTEVGDILYLSQLGVDTGLVLARILLGQYNPSGKLTTTWTKWDEYPQIGEFGDIDNTRYKEGVYVGYRYFDTVGASPMFPFGFGLSYTDFEISCESVTVDGSRITVKASVENTGDMAGKEIVQVYVSKPEGELDQPFQSLAGFKKTSVLSAGESETVEIAFSMEDLASYQEESSSYILEAGDYILRVGSSSRDTDIAAVLRLDSYAVVCRAQNVLGKPGFEDWKPDKAEQSALPEDVDIIEISAEDITAAQVDYNLEEERDPFVTSLSDEELVYLTLGAFNPSVGALSVIGNAAQSVAGAAGETTAMLDDYGIRHIVMADGPAGLRLNQKYTIDGKGKIQGVGSSLPAGMTDFLPKAAVWAMDNLLSHKPRKGETVYEQYTTAIPIGTALAQSWNPEIARLCGDIVGREMERFGIHLWLAPALNIHRSILCGRNFEYYSEDPLISGVFAAAITEGVQKHPGCGTTIKHFAANSQETNRMGSNSLVSERAMREIYLKGFEICVKTAQPRALMTSYNLLNGTHTSERRGLTTDVLRCEWGFKGIVMTDWVITAMMDKNSVYPAAVPSATLKAGGDLFMPGTSGDFKEITATLKKGRITREVLEKSGSRVLAMIDLLCGSGDAEEEEPLEVIHADAEEEETMEVIHTEGEESGEEAEDFREV